MMKRILQGYSEGTITQNELFLCIARLPEVDEWDRVVDSLSESDQQSFKEWARDFVRNGHMLVAAEVGLLLSDENVTALRDHFDRRGW